MRFQRNISLLLGRMEDHRRVEFTGVELTGSAEIAALVEKAAAGHSSGVRKRAGKDLLVAAPNMSRHRKRIEATMRWRGIEAAAALGRGGEGRWFGKFAWCRSGRLGCGLAAARIQNWP
jgi:hypothetical protein